MSKALSPNKPNFATEANLKKKKQIKDQRDRQLNNYRYFCHYNDAVYMGGMNAYKKHGKGIILHDDGSAAVTQYLHDTLCGQTIVFRQNSIASMLIRNSAQIQIAYKYGKNIIKMPFNEDRNKINGHGVLINSQQNKIFQLVFKRGVITHKILHSKSKDNNGMFRKTEVGKMIGTKHEQAFSLTFDRPDNLCVRFDKNLLTIGFFDDSGQIHGLGFKIYAQNIELNGRNLQIKPLERGYYKNSKIQTFGEKCFQNGNKYMGEFQKGQFQGRGILLCPAALKWVYGKFSSNKLVDVIESNNKRQTQAQYAMWTQNMKLIHKRYRQRWIYQDIELPQQRDLYQMLKDAKDKQTTSTNREYEQLLREDQNNLVSIQTQFEVGRSSHQSFTIVDDLLEKHYMNKSDLSSRKDCNFSSSNSTIKDGPKQNRNELHSLSQSLNGQNRYLMQDPFKIELIKIPQDQIKKQIKDKSSQMKVDNLESTQQLASSYKSLIKMKKQPIQTMETSNGSKTVLDHVQNRKQGRRQWLKPANKKEEEQYYQTKQFSQSPLPRNYENSPTKQLYYQNYVGKVHKRHFNYRDPTELIIHRWHTNAKGSEYSNNYENYLYNDQPIVRNSPIKQQRYPSEKNEKNSQLIPKNRYPQHNYQYWT